ncbi:MAG: hypothetical protein ABI382_03115 [Nakamurella sp.]
MTNRYADTLDVLHTASDTLADRTAMAADLAMNAAHSAAAWAEKAPGQAKDIWDDVVSNVDDVIFSKRSCKCHKRAWLIGVAVAVVVAVVISRRRKAHAAQTNPTTDASSSHKG